MNQQQFRVILMKSYWTWRIKMEFIPYH